MEQAQKTQRQVTPEEWQRVKDLFQEALDLDSVERAPYLERLRADVPALAREVESLLEAHLKAGTALDTPGYVHANFGEEEEHDPWIGRKIGPYQAIARIGQGGMGAVYRAVRVDDHYLKQVAIKVVRGGFATGQHLRRFKNERQIMASLDHPNIARLLDGGTTEENIPYLVMEYIPGDPIDEYCDKHRLGIAQRLKIFVQVCAAVQYAHQNLVIHRDLKPANILVTADGTPKLLDFGIAKLLEPELFFQTVSPTATLMKPMTPEYASPEQVRGQVITTASDVYSLGVVLYQLLTAHPPYALEGRAPLELARAITTLEPEKPSMVVCQEREVHAHAGAVRRLTLDEVSHARSVRPAILRRQLRGDIDNIVLKALRKEVDRRYAGAQQLAEDIERHLHGLPVQARPDTISYRAVKFVRRHAAAVVGAAAVFLALVAGIMITLREAHIANVQRARAERRFNDVRKLARDLMLDVHDSIQYLPGATPARKLIVQDALEYLDSLARESSGDISLQRELATAYEKVGDVQGWTTRSNLGDTAGAAQSFRKSLAIRKTIADATGNDPQSRADLAEAYDKLGVIQAQMGKYNESLDNLKRAVELRKELVEHLPDDQEKQFALATSYDSLSNIYAELTRFELAEDANRRALALLEPLLAASPGDQRYRRNVSIQHKKLGGLAEATGRYDLAQSEYEKALRMDEARWKENASEVLVQRDLAISYGNMGDLLFKTERYPAALKQYRAALAIDQSLASIDPQDAWSQRHLLASSQKVGDALSRLGDQKAAARMYEIAVDIAESHAATDRSSAYAQSDVADTYFKMGAVHFAMASGSKDAPTRKKHLLTSHDWYEKSLDVWLDMKNKGTLSGVNAQMPDLAADAVAKCQSALHDLGAAPPVRQAANH